MNLVACGLWAWAVGCGVCGLWASGIYGLVGGAGLWARSGLWAEGCGLVGCGLWDLFGLWASGVRVCGLGSVGCVAGWLAPGS